ncbi:MAG: zinc ribbon domain-containing protein [Mycobacterium leprae]
MRLKKALLYIVIVCGAVAALSTVAFIVLQPKWDAKLEGVSEYIRRNGLQPTVNQMLAGAPRTVGWVATFVVEVQRMPEDGDQPRDVQIAAAYPSELVGQPADVMLARTRFINSQVVLAPDGQAYEVGMAYRFNVVPVWRAAIWTAELSALIAWLALALWVFADARERASKAAPAWLLLSLLTGPVALAVWLISRYAQDGSFTPNVCPGCGAPAPRGLLHCVKCGYALRPVCPSCGRIVEVEWSHCGNCGTDLKEEA